VGISIEEVTAMKFEIKLTRKQATIGLFHLALIVISLAVSTGFAFVNWRIAFPIMIGELAVVIIIIFSLLDYLDIIEFRKSVTRKTKCCICGRISKAEYNLERLIKLERFESDKQGYSEKEITKVEQVPAKPLEGIVIHDRVVCTDCIDKVKKYG